MATSIADGLFKALPKPKYTGEDEEPASNQRGKQKGPRIVGPEAVDQSQVVLRVRPISTCYFDLRLYTNRVAFTRYR